MVNTSKQFTKANKCNSKSHMPGLAESSAYGGLAGMRGNKPGDREKARVIAFNKHFMDKVATGTCKSR